MRLLVVERDAQLGTRHFTGALLKGFARQGHACQLLIGGGPSLNYLERLAERRWALPFGAGLVRWQTGRVLRAAAPDAALVIVNEATFPALEVCVQRQLPVVGLLLGKVDLRTGLAALEQARAVVVLNQNLRDWVTVQYPSLADKLFLSHKLVDRELFHPPASRPADGYRIACLSRLSRSKGQIARVALQAAAALQAEIPGLELTVVGLGSQLGRLKALARELNRAADREFVSVPGGTREPERVLHHADLVLAAGFSATEALACHCQLLGVGFQGLYGLVTPANLDEALAWNFGDTGAHHTPVTPELVAAQIREAYARRGEPRDWIEGPLASILDAEDAIRGLETLLQP